MVTVCAPSSSTSSTAVTTNVFDTWLAGIVTVADTVASDVSLLSRVTTSNWLMSESLRVTVPVALPPFSLIAAGLIDMVNVGVPTWGSCTIS